MRVRRIHAHIEEAAARLGSLRETIGGDSLLAVAMSIDNALDCLADALTNLESSTQWAEEPTRARPRRARTTGTNLSPKMAEALDIARTQGGTVYAGWNGRRTFVSASTIAALVRRGKLTAAISAEGGQAGRLTEAR